MRPKSTLMFTIFLSLSLILIAGGCRRSRQYGAEAKRNAEEKIAPSDAVAAASPAPTIADKGGEGIDFPEHQQISRTYRLIPGMKVSVSNINGKIDVETANTDMAEVLIVRSAKTKEELQFHNIIITHQPKHLRIAVEEDRGSIWSALGKSPEGRQRVMLRLPRRVEFQTHGLNGELNVGELDGEVEINGVNGNVKIAQATGEAKFRGINGNIDLTIAGLIDGIDLNGVNGNTEIGFIGPVNAMIDAWGMNGKVDSDLPNFEVKQTEGFGRYEARIGIGGPEIEIRGVNGNLNLVKSQKQPVPATKTATR
ncbi:MAG: hypothetical protein L0220_14645 [Acidobacteria bacterium]|nr:hypothetical protein [Acidobacteriota bacterium]